ncbi:MAG TPA: hypothetical protein VGU24_18440 [Microvirga sp.]|jgi:hypothetical protein|nr:hypothetical protein [Microvirga sp.]
MIIAALSIAAIGFMLWLLFTFAVYALPFYAGLSAAFFAYQHDAGLVGAAVIGLIAAGLVFGVGQALFATLRSPFARTLVAAIYAAPAGVAGYHAVRGLSAATGTGEPWATMFCIVAAVVVAGVAWIRVSALHPGDSVRAVEPAAYATSQPIGAANDG